MTAAVQMKNVNKFYGAFHALKDVNLSVAKGEKIVVCGPSGSGKSTMIRTINQLEEHQSGDTAYQRRDVLYVAVKWSHEDVLGSGSHTLGIRDGIDAKRSSIKELAQRKNRPLDRDGLI